LRHGIARALVVVDSDLKTKLKKEGLMTRDLERSRERNSVRKGARARFQFSKR